ncbi:hypothetical protein BDZ91DRAFT_794632 [Kalaharituber pfeilii]|nr:hypothetical protein BDZ91DRAFT_794632 [Kalaharituber pfeilii]
MVGGSEQRLGEDAGIRWLRKKQTLVEEGKLTSSVVLYLEKPAEAGRCPNPQLKCAPSLSGLAHFLTTQYATCYARAGVRYLRSTLFLKDLCFINFVNDSFHSVLSRADIPGILPALDSLFKDDGDYIYRRSWPNANTTLNSSEEEEKRMKLRCEPRTVEKEVDDDGEDRDRAEQDQGGESQNGDGEENGEDKGNSTSGDLETNTDVDKSDAGKGTFARARIVAGVAGVVMGGVMILPVKVIRSIIALKTHGIQVFSRNNFY